MSCKDAPDARGQPRPQQHAYVAVQHRCMLCSSFTQLHAAFIHTRPFLSVFLTRARMFAQVHKHAGSTESETSSGSNLPLGFVAAITVQPADTHTRPSSHVCARTLVEDADMPLAAAGAAGSRHNMQRSIHQRLRQHQDTQARSQRCEGEVREGREGRVRGREERAETSVELAH
jgi:hypothetical protein